MFMDGIDWMSDVQRTTGTETMQTVLHVAQENGWTAVDLIRALVLFIVSRGLAGDLSRWIRRCSVVRLPPSHGTA